MKRSMQLLLVVAGFAAAGAFPAQAQVPQIQYQAEDALSDFPDDIHLGEAAGVARNSDGEIFVYTRTGNPYVTTGGSRYVSHGGARLFQFDSDGEFEREIGQETYGALYAQQVRVDPADHIWTVDQMSGQVIRYDPDGRIVMVMSRKPEAMRVPERDPEETSGEGREGESFQGPTDVTWDSQGNFYVADGIRNARIAKYDVNGKWVMNWGMRSDGPGEFNVIKGLRSTTRTTSTWPTTRTGGSRSSTREGTSKGRCGASAPPWQSASPPVRTRSCMCRTPTLPTISTSAARSIGWRSTAPSWGNSARPVS